jgi:hypothetical protein
MQRAAMILMLALVAGPSCALGADQEEDISSKCHPWGLFSPGAWKTVRIVVETLNDQGWVVSTCDTDTKTTLVDVNKAGVTLEVHSCMEVAGKLFDPEPQIIKQGFNGELLGPSVKQNPPIDGELTIDGQKIPCHVQRLEWTVPNGKTVVTLHYSMTVAPYILKRVCVTTDPEGKNILSETTVETIALNVPLTVRGEQRNGIKMKTVQRSSSGVVTTLADVLLDVPGGIVSNSSKELDQSGRLIRRSTLQLIDYGTEPDRTGLFGRKRPPRHRTKTPPHHEP